ncbi:MAG TPA: lipid-binding SYLF domain-containing protein [Blastocatellia bacterium]|nr:lipid-binding SYLF domain-containing protein [Blastocatellia bacterium]
MKCTVLSLVLLLVVSPLVLAAGGGKREDEVQRVKRAAEVFNEIMGAPDKGIPEDLLSKSECVAIVPGLKKGGLGFGGKYGKGVVMCRRPERKNWTAPSFITIEGGSFGLQIGFQQSDIVMLIMNRKGIDKLIGDKFTIGADASAAAGPVGREAAAQTNVRLDAEILTYSRAKGLFAGISLDGATCRQDKDNIRDFYGKDIAARDILLEGKVPMPQEAVPLATALSRQSPRKK